MQTPPTSSSSAASLEKSSTDDFHDVDGIQLCDEWKKGNHKFVIDNLSKRHAGVTAVFIVQRTLDGLLTRDDCCAIANLLLEDFIRIRDSKGIEATCRQPE